MNQDDGCAGPQEQDYDMGYLPAAAETLLDVFRKAKREGMPDEWAMEDVIRGFLALLRAARAAGGEREPECRCPYICGVHMGLPASGGATESPTTKWKYDVTCPTCGFTMRSPTQRSPLVIDEEACGSPSPERQP